MILNYKSKFQYVQTDDLAEIPPSFWTEGNQFNNFWFTKLMSEKTSLVNTRFGPETLPGVRNSSVIWSVSGIFTVTSKGAGIKPVYVAIP